MRLIGRRAETRRGRAAAALVQACANESLARRSRQSGRLHALRAGPQDRSAPFLKVTFMQKADPRRLALALFATLGFAGLAHADPQTERSVEERRTEVERNKRDEAKEEKGQQAAPAPTYPNATRQEPEARASAKIGKQLEKLFDAYNAQDAATVLPLADQIIANESANAYERAIAARLAGASLLNQDNARALGYMQRAVEFNGLNNNEHFESMLLVAQLQLQEQKYAESLATIDKFLAETRSQQPEHLVVKGNALYRLQRYPEAAAALKQAVETSPQPDPQWLQLLMGAYADMGQPAEASKVAESLAGKNPNDKQTQMNLASIYMESGQDDKAVAILEKLRAGGQLDGENDYRNLYAMYINGEKYKEGIAVINEGLEKGLLKPDFATYNALAQAYWFSDQSAQAIEAYKKAAPLAPNGETYLNLARALSNEGRAGEAKEAAKQALAKGVAKPEDANRIIGAK
jgi:tetratricopeptide (TPR) repeat protein